MIKCNNCNKELETYDALRRHTGRVHKISSIDFFVEYNLSGIWPVCKCGCGGKVKWSYRLKGFCDYCQGHQSRVVNNWGHNPMAVLHSTETRRRQFKNGERKMWNIGLTKDTNDSVKICGEKTAARYTPAIRKQYSIRMKKLIKDGKIVPLRGAQHSQWNGGTSSVSMLVYNDIKLYKEWKYPILCRDGFKCTKCGNTMTLHVHHNKEMLYEIIKKYVGDGIDTTNYDLKRSIADLVVEYHIKNNVSGITLCEKCHGKIHPSLNF